MISPINARPKRLQPVPSEAFAGLHLSLSEDRGDHGPALSLQLLLPLTLNSTGSISQSCQSVQVEIKSKRSLKYYSATHTYNAPSYKFLTAFQLH